MYELHKFYTSLSIACNANSVQWQIIYAHYLHTFFISDFIFSFRKIADEKGMQTSAPNEVCHFRQGRDQIEGMFMGLKDKIPSLQLIVVVLDEDTNYGMQLLIISH